MPYVAFESNNSPGSGETLCKKDKPLEIKLSNAKNAIVTNPENFDSPLKADRCHSLKKKAVGERYRIIYRYCERCIQVHKIICEDCKVSKY